VELQEAKKKIIAMEGKIEQLELQIDDLK